MPRAVFDTNHEARLQTLRAMLGAMEAEQEPDAKVSRASAEASTKQGESSPSLYRITGTLEGG